MSFRARFVVTFSTAKQPHNAHTPSVREARPTGVMPKIRTRCSGSIRTATGGSDENRRVAEPPAGRVSTCVIFRYTLALYPLHLIWDCVIHLVKAKKNYEMAAPCGFVSGCFRLPGVRRSPFFSLDQKPRREKGRPRADAGRVPRQHNVVRRRPAALPARQNFRSYPDAGEVPLRENKPLNALVGMIARRIMC